MSFLRRTWSRYSKLGKRRKKKQKWKKPTGRDNKMREKRRGYPAVVSIGYKKKKKLEKIVIVRNIKELDAVKKNEIVIIGKVGKKKKIEILKKAKGKKIKFQNINAEKFLKKNVKVEKEKVEEKKNQGSSPPMDKKNETK